MSASGRSPLRPLAVGGIAGLIVGCLIGWLAIGWWLWPVEYVGDAYTYELNQAEKTQYVAAVVDSYNLTGQLGVVQQRLNAWTVEEKNRVLAMLFADYQSQGKMQEAEQVVELAMELQRAEGWDPAVVSQAASQVAAEYAEQGEPQKAQLASVFASELGATVVVSPGTEVSATPPSGTPVPTQAGASVRALLPVCGVLTLIALVILAFLALRRRRPRPRPVAEEPRVEWTATGPLPLLHKASSYKLGMDSFDESFAIESESGEWLGECGMGIAEALDGAAPRRVTAFEVWLFDKPNTRTVTKVLMSEFANDNEALRNKLSVRGEPVLAVPGATFTLETPALIIEAQVKELEYGEGPPVAGYFRNLSLSLIVNRRVAQANND